MSASRLLAALLTFGMLASLALAFASVLHGERSAEHSRRLLLKAADQQLLVQQMAGAAREAALGHKSAFAELGALGGRFSRSQQELMEGLSSDLLHSPETVRGAAAAVTASWDSLRADLSRIAGAEQDMLWFRELARATRRQLYELQGASQRAAELLTQLDAEPRSVLDAALQLTRVQAMIEALDDTLAGGSQAARSIELAIASADEYEVALGDLRAPLAASGELGSPALRGALGETRLLYREMRNNAEALASLLPAVLPALEAAERIQTDERMAEEGLDELMLALRGATGRPTFGGVPVGTGTALLFAAVALAFLGLLGLQQLMQSRRRERASMAQNRANREAIERLIDEMGELADGDLTVRATVTDEVTGAIAESVNYAVEALRALVATINATSEKLNDSAQRTREAATRLARGSDAQANQIDAASGSIAAMTAAIDEIAGNAGESAAVASRAVLVAGRGAQAVRDTIDGMSRISGPIQETSRRIKRLGNSSQEIGEIVELIDDIADQTNILALNAAMQAAMAGDAGRGFAVVADEVQRLAERSSNATKQIEAIVRSIRSDTGEAVRSMETSMAGVVAGTKVAENAGTALREIENVSNYIADLTRRIADSAGNESRAAAKVNDTVKSLLDITQQTAQGTRTTAESVEALAALADELRHSVAGFRLPRG